MSCCCSGFCTGARRTFDVKLAESNLRRYRRKGPNPTTRFLRDGVLAAGGGQTLLDIGAGIGPLSMELLQHGFERSTLVDASPAYRDVARRFAREQGLEARVAIEEGDFAAEARRFAAADAVVLDRVVCCYPDFEMLLATATDHARRVLGYAYPRERWFVRAWIAVENVVAAVTRNPFRAFVHPETRMAALLEARGFRRVSRRENFIWCADVYVRDAGATAASSRG